VPRIGLRTARGLATTAFVLAALFAAIAVPRYYFFPALLLYATWGLVKSVLLGLLDRLPGGDPLRDVGEGDTADDRAEVRDLDYGPLASDAAYLEDASAADDPDDRAGSPHSPENYT